MTKLRVNAGACGYKSVVITEQIEGEGASFSLADAASPTIVRDTADGSALYVLMPMRV